MNTSCFDKTTLVGFDSAWADRMPGALCALIFDGKGEPRFEHPRRLRFDDASSFIADLHKSDRKTVVAIDQPTIVPNRARARPCERVVGSVMGWVGGGIQSSYREKTPQTLFGDKAPIWRFLDQLAFCKDPMQAWAATVGGFVMEVFPALALLGLDPTFAAAKAAPCYNPRGRRFRQDDWRAVCVAVGATAEKLDMRAVAEWCVTLNRYVKPSKAAQDSLDAVICLLVAALWLVDRSGCSMIGNLSDGYIIAPVVSEIRTKLAAAAERNSVTVT